MTGSLALYAIGGLLLIGFGGRLRRTAYVVAAVPPAISTGWAAAQLPRVVDGETLTSSTAWVPGLGLSLDLRLDGIALIMTLIVAGMGVLTMLYAARYFSPDAPGHGRLAGLLLLFAGAMVGLAQADHLLAFYAFWELTTITSYLLIGNDHSVARARAAALHALAATGTGGVALLGGVVLLGHTAGTFQITELIADPPAAAWQLTVVVLLLFLAAFTKSAQYPFHAWLPGAMVAPTPVSAYLHSAAMVKAGVYLVALFAPVFAATVGVWRPLVLVVGTITLIAGGLRALRQNDLKLLLAYGTVSQLGFLILLFGAGVQATTLAGLVLLVSHAMFKGALFMVVGILDRVAGTRDLRELPRLDGRWRLVEVVALVSAASMAGVPLMLGFIAKEAAYASLVDSPFPGSWLLLAGVVVGSIFTAAYAWRFYWGAFVAPRRHGRQRSPRSPDLLFVLPSALLAAGTLALGLVPGLADRVMAAGARALGFDGEIHLVLWHGFSLPLGLSALTFAGAAVLAAGDRRLQRVLSHRAAIPSGQNVHLWLLRLLQTVSAKVTAVTQNGSLPAYAAVILTTAAVLPLGALVTAGRWTGWPALGRLADIPPIALLLVAATGSATVRSRFSAAVFLGVAGYAMAALFVASGAPDLALTQAVVETLSTVVFVLVLRWLPRDFDREPMRPRKVARLAAAVLVAGSVFVFALITAGTPSSFNVSDELVALSVPEGHGRNVVNVILVDFRALDTLAEITVLAAAAIGAVALARVGVRTAAARGELPERSSVQDVRRIVFLDVPVRIIFYAVLLMSLWLLFAGHNQPGGGFVGGLLAGCAITLRYISGGMAAVRGRSRFRPWTVLGTGLLLASVTATAPLLSGGNVLEVAYGEVPVLGLGDVTISSALAFDAGVYIAVVGIVLMAFEAFGDEFPFRAR